jgi:hypothetical protein
MRTCFAAALLVASFLTAFLVPTDARAQDYTIDQGSLILGGGVAFSRTARATPFARERRTGLSIQPRAQYFVAPNVAIGGAVLVGRSQVGATGRNRQGSVGVGPAFSYYFGRAGSRVLPYLSTSALVVSGDSHVYQGTTSVGLTVLIARHVALAGEWFLAADLANTSAQVFGLQLGARVFLW